MARNRAYGGAPTLSTRTPLDGTFAGGGKRGGGVSGHGGGQTLSNNPLNVGEKANGGGGGTYSLNAYGGGQTVVHYPTPARGGQGGEGGVEGAGPAAAGTLPGEGGGYVLPQPQ